MGIAEETVTRLRREYPDISVVARSSTPGTTRKWWLPLRLWWLSLTARWRSRARRRSQVSGARRPYQPGLADPTAAGPVLAVRVGIDGIRGGRSTARCRYQLIIDTTDLAKAIPDVWVVSPTDGEIKHVNIWPAHKSLCRWSGTKLPSFCWYTYANAWLAAPRRSRTLGAALEYVKQLLNTENHDSLAR
jgi:hypothetical protein